MKSLMKIEHLLSDYRSTRLYQYLLLCLFFVTPLLANASDKIVPSLDKFKLLDVRYKELTLDVTLTWTQLRALYRIMRT